MSLFHFCNNTWSISDMKENETAEHPATTYTRCLTGPAPSRRDRDKGGSLDHSFLALV
jgi:hypothetical protein